MGPRNFEAAWFRQVLAQYPTGVCVVAAMSNAGRPAGMTVGSFISVSLDPPLVAFLPSKTSSCWREIRAARRFCVNILSAEQEDLCRRFASSRPDRFEGIGYRVNEGGGVILEGCVAWIDCALEAVHDAGDHEIVVGRVEWLNLEAGSLPLLFFRGGYGRFSPLSLATSSGYPEVISERLHLVDVVRRHMEDLASRLRARCLATVELEGELLLAASAGQTGEEAIPTLVGVRVPNVPPSSSIFAAWAADSDKRRWLALADDRDAAEQALRNVRERGFSLGLASEGQREFSQSLRARGRAHRGLLREEYRGFSSRMAYDPPNLDDEALGKVRLITVPVFDGVDRLALALTVFDFPSSSPASRMWEIIEHVRSIGQLASREVERRLASACSAGIDSAKGNHHE